MASRRARSPSSSRRAGLALRRCMSKTRSMRYSVGTGILRLSGALAGRRATGFAAPGLIPGSDERFQVRDGVDVEAGAAPFLVVRSLEFLLHDEILDAHRAPNQIEGAVVHLD